MIKRVKLFEFQFEFILLDLAPAPIYLIYPHGIAKDTSANLAVVI